jgi:hypothetical protein
VDTESRPNAELLCILRTRGSSIQGRMLMGDRESENIDVEIDPAVSLGIHIDDAVQHAN